MIVRHLEDRVLLITQPAHALLASAFMRRCEPLTKRPHRDSILHAIAEHDGGWAVEDAEPRVDAHGRVVDFIHAPAAVRQAVWPRSVERLAGDPWAAALVAQHAITVYDRFRTDAEWAAFFAGMEDARDERLRAADLTLDDLLADYAFLRLGDLISLAFCTGEPGTLRFGRWTVASAGRRVTVTPDIFGGEEIALEIAATEIPPGPFGSDAELRDACAAGKATTLRGILAGPEEPEAAEDFAALFEASIKAKRFKEGQTIEGRIVAIGPEVAFVDVGGKGEATIDIEELKDGEGDIEVAVGDRIQAMVLSAAGGLRLSRRLAQGAATARQLEDAFRAGLPVEGKVESEVKGGFEVRIGRARGFCPFSQIDRHRSEPATHLGKVYTFRIVEYKEAGRNLVVSRRALLEEEQRASAAEVRRSIVAGAVLTGRVASVREFGAFVDLGGGIQGLLHISEMGWSHVADPSALVTPGDSITVKVLRVEDDGRKIALGLKQLAADPWSGVSAKYEAGQVVTGRVTRILDFGAFVEIEPGVEALAHASTFPPTRAAGDWSRQVTPGMTAAFEVLTIDLEKKRMGVALLPEGSARAEAAAPAAAGDEPDAAGTPGFGSLADKLRGALEPRS